MKILNKYLIIKKAQGGYKYQAIGIKPIQHKSSVYIFFIGLFICFGNESRIQITIQIFVSINNLYKFLMWYFDFVYCRSFWCGISRFGIISCGLVDLFLYGFLLYGFSIVWYSFVWLCIVRYGLVWFGCVWYGLVWFGCVW